MPLNRVGTRDVPELVGAMLQRTSWKEQHALRHGGLKKSRDQLAFVLKGVS